MTVEQVFAEAVTNTPGGVVIHTTNITEILEAINQKPGYPFVAKNIPDQYTSRQGYDWQRRNPRKFLIWKIKD